MKDVWIVLFFFSTIANLYSQNRNLGKEGEVFNSVFQKLGSGDFEGTINGVLFIKNMNDADVILDFQGSNAKLLVEKDKDEVYDVSVKRYIGYTTSGRTKITYETYATANGLQVEINGNEFELSFLDGASDMVIDGLNYYYKSEPGVEYLVLNVTKELILNNWQYLIRTEHRSSPDNIGELNQKMKSIKVMPNSTLTFIIKRN